MADQGRVFGEPVGDVAVHPAALVLQRAGQVPVIERRIGLDAAFEHAVDQPIVELEALGIHRADPLRDEAGPGEGEAVGVEAAVADQIEVAGPAVVVVAGDGAGIEVLHIAGGRRKRVPDRGAAAIGLAAFDLVGGRGGAEGEVGAELVTRNRKHGGFTPQQGGASALVVVVPGRRFSTSRSM